MTPNIAINGLGRIGRATLKTLLDSPRFRVAAVNDLVSADNLAYLLRYDTVYGRWAKKVAAAEGGLLIEDVSIPVFSRPDPRELPWAAMNIDLVFECTGRFTTEDQRLLWASTGTKNPAASDIFYITALAAPSTIATMPEETLKAFADHGEISHILPTHARYCDHALAEFAEAGIDVDALGARLQTEGVRGFIQSWDSLLECVASKRESLALHA